MNILCLTSKVPSDFRLPPGIDLVEWRIDLTELDETILPQLKGQWLATLRDHTHGGGFNGSDEEREKILLKALALGAKWVDVEAEFPLGNIPEDKVVRSIHLQTNTAEEIAESYQRMIKAPGQLRKWVRPTPYTEDLCAEEKNLITDKIPCVIIHSAAGGQWSRARAPGHNWNYLPIDAEHRSGEGQLTWAENLRLAEGELYGIIGNPLDHSKSPFFQNRMRRALGWQGGFVKVPLENVEGTDAFFKSELIKKFSGFSVTMPHKANVIRGLTRSSEAVKLLDACNTLTRKGDEWEGENTDYLAVKRVIEDNRKSQEDTVAVIGVGGFGRAAAVAALHSGHKVVLVNRSFDKAQHWAKEWGCEAVEIENFSASDYPIIIQATSAEMLGHPCPVDTSTCQTTALLVECLYNTGTDFMNKAPESCCKISGALIFQYQAQEQLKIWEGTLPPDDLSCLAMTL